ncbi:MAG: DUF2156 domain-containing protein [Treponema sp.]
MILSNDLLEIKNSFFAKNSTASEDCFLGFLVWQEKYKFKKVNLKNAFAIRLEKNSSYWFPFADSEEDAVNAVAELMADKNLCFERVTQEQKRFLEVHFKDLFSFEDDRGNYDYLYDIDSLCTLSGRKLSKKRNHINGFLQSYGDWNVQEINSSNVQEVLEFAGQWYQKKSGGDSEIGEESLDYERKSLVQIVPQMEKIGADGIALYVDGKVAAFTVGMRISESVYDTVFEKADDGIKGSYNIINREFARYLKNKYASLKFINREQDLNLAGLRQAKLSYMPCRLVEKFAVKQVHLN